MSLPADLALRLELETLYADYVHALDDDRLEDWPKLFTEDCFYEVISRENHDRDLPLAAMRFESRAMLEDRVVTIRQTLMYEPRYLRHVVSSLRVLDALTPQIACEANYAVFETLMDDPTRVLNVGRYLDRVVREDGTLRFSSKSCVFDSVLIPNSLVYPI